MERVPDLMVYELNLISIKRIEGEWYWALLGPIVVMHQQLSHN